MKVFLMGVASTFAFALAVTAGFADRARAAVEQGKWLSCIATGFQVNRGGVQSSWASEGTFLWKAKSNELWELNEDGQLLAQADNPGFSVSDHLITVRDGSDAHGGSIRTTINRISLEFKSTEQTSYGVHAEAVGVCKPITPPKLRPKI